VFKKERKGRWWRRIRKILREVVTKNFFHTSRSLVTNQPKKKRNIEKNAIEISHSLFPILYLPLRLFQGYTTLTSLTVTGQFLFLFFKTCST
jgi:hypothetical protein